MHKNIVEGGIYQYVFCFRHGIDLREPGQKWKNLWIKSGKIPRTTNEQASSQRKATCMSRRKVRRVQNRLIGWLKSVVQSVLCTFRRASVSAANKVRRFEQNDQNQTKALHLWGTHASSLYAEMFYCVTAVALNSLYSPGWLQPKVRKFQTFLFLFLFWPAVSVAHALCSVLLVVTGEELRQVGGCVRALCCCE